MQQSATLLKILSKNGTRGLLRGKNWDGREKKKQQDITPTSYTSRSRRTETWCALRSERLSAEQGGGQPEVNSTWGVSILVSLCLAGAFKLGFIQQVIPVEIWAWQTHLRRVPMPPYWGLCLAYRKGPQRMSTYGGIHSKQSGTGRTRHCNCAHYALPCAWLSLEAKILDEFLMWGWDARWNVS